MLEPEIARPDVGVSIGLAGSIKRAAWWLCFLSVCGLLVASGSAQLRHLAATHRSAQFWLLLSLLLTIPTSLVTLGVGFLLEWLLLGWSRSSLKTLWQAGASARADMVSIVMTLLPQRSLGYVLSLGLLYVIDAFTAQSAGISLTHWLPSWGVQVVCVLLLRSFCGYWMHRLEHSIPILWSLHQFHHSADRMSIFTAERHSQLVRGVEAAILVVPFVLLAAPTAEKPAVGSPAFLLLGIYFAYTTFLRVNGYLCHSNLTTDYGWIGGWLLLSPRIHRLHHAAAPEYHDKNFSADLVIWDRLFGTYATCDVATLEEVPLGLADNPFNRSGTLAGVLRDYFLTTVTVFWRSLCTGPRAWVPAKFSRSRGLSASAP